MQTLPSISIFEEVPKTRTNVSMEVIREHDFACGDSSNVTPLLTESTINVTSDSHFQNISKVPSSLRIPNQQIQRPKKSLFTETTNHSHVVEKNMVGRDSFKSLIKEALEDFQVRPGCEQLLSINKENVDLYKEMSHEIPHQMSSECNKHKCSSQKNINDKKIQKAQEDRKYFTYSQTDDSYGEKLISDRQCLKDVVREVIAEYQTFFTSVIEAKRIQEMRKIEDVQMHDKEMQTDSSIIEKKPESYSVSKDVQNSSFHEDSLLNYSSPQSKDLKCGRISEPHTDQDKWKSRPSLETNITTSNKIEFGTEVTKQLSDVTSKIEKLTDAFNSHLCSASTNVAKNSVSDVVSQKTKAISTRDVSLQFSPYLINRSVHTSPTRAIEKANQCNITIQEVKNVFSSGTQTSIVEPDKTEKVNVFTQCEHIITAVIDSCTQTGESIPIAQASEHSANTSVSSTPVSDNLFLDDIISEGEVPWHLRLSSSHDKNIHYSSSNVAESSTASEEKDYSLSEGEIHPNYIKHWYDMYSAVDRDQAVADSKNYSNPPFHRSSTSEVQSSSDKSSNASSAMKSKATSVNNSITHLSAGELQPPSQSPLVHPILFGRNVLHQAKSELTKSSISEHPNHECSTYQSSGEVSYSRLFNRYEISPNDDCKENSFEADMAPSIPNDRRCDKDVPKHFLSNKAASQHHLESQSSSNFSLLSSIDCSSGEILHETGEILQSTPRESVGEYIQK